MRLIAVYSKRDCDLHSFILLYQSSVLPSKADIVKTDLLLVWDLWGKRGPRDHSELFPLKRKKEGREAGEGNTRKVL